MMKVLITIFFVTFAVAEPPYPPSGWQPAGDRLRLPLRKLKLQAPVPHTVYGPPSTVAPGSEDSGYLPPDEEQVDTVPSNGYGPPPDQPANGYGPPGQPEEVDNSGGSQQPGNGYSPSQQPDDGYSPSQQPDNGYGPSQQPGNGYPSQQPDNGYGPPQQPNNGYGPPQKPNNGYGPPQQQPSNGYSPSQQPDNGYAPSQQPNNGYGPPQQQPDNESPQQPDNGYGPPQNPDYESPPEGNGQLPVDQGASEKLRQSQFFQQTPHFEPARFRPRQTNGKLRQQIKPATFQRQQQTPNFRPQNFAPTNQQRPNNFRSQNFRQVPTETQTLIQNQAQPNTNIESFESKKIPATRHQLYATQTPQLMTGKPKTRTTTTERSVFEAEGPNIAVATAVAGRYYVLQRDGLLQEVTYKIKDGKVTDGRIKPNLRYTDLAPITDSVYQFGADNRLVRIS